MELILCRPPRAQQVGQRPRKPQRAWIPGAAAVAGSQAKQGRGAVVVKRQSAVVIQQQQAFTQRMQCRVVKGEHAAQLCRPAAAGGPAQIAAEQVGGQRAAGQCTQGNQEDGRQLGVAGNGHPVHRDSGRHQGGDFPVAVQDRNNGADGGAQGSLEGLAEGFPGQRLLHRSAVRFADLVLRAVRQPRAVRGHDGQEVDGRGIHDGPGVGLQDAAGIRSRHRLQDKRVRRHGFGHGQHPVGTLLMAVPFRLEEQCPGQACGQAYEKSQLPRQQPAGQTPLPQLVPLKYRLRPL